MSLYARFGLPDAVAVILFTLALVVALSPYLGGRKLAGLDIPDFGPAQSARLRRYGWIPLVIALLGFLRIPSSTNATTLTARAVFHPRDTTVACTALAGTRATLQIDTNTYRATVGPSCVAEFADVPKSYVDHDARLAFDSPSAYIVTRVDGHGLDATGKLSAVFEDTASAPRLSIDMLVFDMPDPVARSQFNQFRDALRMGIQNLPAIFGGGASFSYVRRLELQIDSTSRLNSAQALADRWERSHALQLLSGQVDGDKGTAVVHMTVWLGALAPKPEYVSLPLSMRVSPDAFARNRNGYSLVTLYALARDARQRHMPTDVIAAILAKANAVRQELGDMPGDGELQPIVVGIDSMLADLRRSKQ